MTKINQYKDFFCLVFILSLHMHTCVRDKYSRRNESKNMNENEEKLLKEEKLSLI